jgi:putative transposase
MPKKRYRPEEIISKLREADVLIRQGKKVVEVIKALGVTDVTYYRWRQEYGGMSVPQAKRLKELEKENERLRKAVSDLTLDKMILKEAARGNF